MLKLLILTNIWYYSAVYDLDPQLVEAIVHVESSFDAKAVGGVGEIGLMQMKPYYLPGPLKLTDPETNIAVGCYELAKLKRLKPKLGDYWFVAWNLGATGALRYADNRDISKFRYAMKINEQYPKKRERAISPIRLASN